VLQFAKHESVASVLRGFRRQFQSDPPSANSIRHWYQQFQTTGCICKRKSAGRPRALVESVERVRQSEEICAPCESWIGDGDHDCVEDVAKGTGNEALSSSLVAVSSIILVHGVLERYMIRISTKTPAIFTKILCGFAHFPQLSMKTVPLLHVKHFLLNPFPFTNSSTNPTTWYYVDWVLTVSWNKLQGDTKWTE
jgi:hypothetical protein